LSVSSLLAKALEQHRAGDLAEAERGYQRVLKLDAHHADALHLLGVLANQRGEPTRAVELIRRAIESNGKVAAYHNNMGNAQKALGAFAEAEASYSEALRLDQNNQSAAVNLARLFEAQNRWAEASTAYEAILARASAEQAAALALYPALSRVASAMGQRDKALQYAQTAVKIAPLDAEAWLALGNLRYAESEWEMAQTAYQRAVKLDERNASAHFNLANTLRELHREEEAIEQYLQSIALDPKQTDAHTNLGLIYASLDRGKEALQSLQRALDLAPGSAQTHFNLGRELARVKDFQRALPALQRAVEIDPNHAKAWQTLGVAQHELQLPEEACTSYREALRCNPESAEVWNNLGLALSDLERDEEATAAIQHALQLDPQFAEAHLGLCRQLARTGGISGTGHRAALLQVERALEIRPEYGEAYNNRGVSQQALGDLDAALRSFERALVLLPDSAEAHLNYAMALLLHGDYPHGWQEYEWRWKTGVFRKNQRDFTVPLWTGCDLNGATILLHGEQGFGDVLQFVRYCPLVAERGGRVLLEVPERLHALLEHYPGVSQCLRLGDALPDFAWHCPLMSLPMAFATTLTSVPDFDPKSLHPRGVRSFGSGVHIGLSWAADPKVHWGRTRSITLREFQPLGAIPNASQHRVTFVSLQRGAGTEQASQENLSFLLIEACKDDRDFADAAAVVAELDLVITVDTAVAHLAASMGKEVWILTPPVPCWRWGLEDEHSPWYPTARVLRATYAGSWSELMQRVARDLELWLTARS